MSTSGRKNISFRFSRKNDEDQVQETEEAESDDENLFDASLGASSLQPSTSIGGNAANRSQSSGSNWLNDSWRKFTAIVEEHKEKSSTRKDGSRSSAVYRELNSIGVDPTDDRDVRVETGQTSELLPESVDDEEEVFLGEEMCELDADNDLSPTSGTEKPSTLRLITDPYDLSEADRLNVERPRSSSDRSPSTESPIIVRMDQKRFSLFSRFRHDATTDKISASASTESIPKSLSNQSIAVDDTISNRSAQSTIRFRKSLDPQPLPQSPKSTLIDTSGSTMTDDDSRTARTDKVEPDSDPMVAYLLNPFVRWCRSQFSVKYFLSASLTVLAAIAFFQISPFSAFGNGFLLGWAFAIFNCGILFAYALSKIFQKLDSENERHRNVLSGQKWKSMPAFATLPNTNDQSFEGWFYELVYSKKFGIDRYGSEGGERSEFSDAKARLIYVRLENTLLRVFIPKGDQIKKPPLTDDRIHFYKHSSKMNQHIYDFSLMKKARISLWLPKNIRDRSKYMWMLKYPLILTLQETNRLVDINEREPVKLILFARTNRDKEEWFSRFRSAIESCEHAPANRSTTTQSTPEERPRSVDRSDHMSRTMSLDIGDWQQNDFEHLSSLLSFDTFMQEILGHSNGGDSTGSTNTNATATSGNPSIPKRQINNNLLWFNALVGRMLFDFLTHSHWTRWVQFKIQRKLSRIKLPYFIQTLTLKDVHLGHSVPKFLSVPSNPVLNEKGLWVDMELDYQGCFTMTLETKLDLMRLKDSKASERELKPMNLSPSFSTLNAPVNVSLDAECDEFSDPESIVDLSDDDSEESWSIENDSRQGKLIKYLDKIASSNLFQQATENKFVKRKMEEVSNMPLLLTVTLQELRGVLTINLPRPSSDRLWYGFRDNPKLVLEAQPAFGQRVVSLTHISQWIAKKLKQEFNKLLVIPNMDDITIQPMMSGETFIDETLL
jgi:hypothetical protein